MNLHPVLPDGFVAAGLACGIKKNDLPDLGLVVADQAYPAQALFTQNHLLGAHVTLCREHLQRSANMVRAVLVNSGNANCATGAKGMQDARQVCAALAEELDCPVEQILFMSTGVIGAPLPVEKILRALPALAASLSSTEITAFARAIMTTDTHPKLVNKKDGAQHCLGVAKGAGMVHPNMATMLAFLFSNGSGESKLGELADRSFHCLSVDNDTSPNDTLLLWSSQANSGQTNSDRDQKLLSQVSQDLCKLIARDGEGASRLVTIQIEGAKTAAQARQAGRQIATSMLVKTAITGRDPNWGRILSAAATAGVEIDAQAARVWIGDWDMYADGQPQLHNEAAASQYMQQQEELILGVDLAAGKQHAQVWTCDLTADYVRINADYRT